MDFIWSLEGRVFIEHTDFEQKTNPYEDVQNLYKKELGVSQLTSENFENLSRDMKDRIDSFRLCGAIGATQYAHLGPKEIMIDPEPSMARY